MPKSKTVEIDEIVTTGKPIPGDKPPRTEPPPVGNNPFANLENALPWKARWTLRLTRWFMLLRSKRWGKLVIIPAVILGLLLILPLGLLAVCFLMIRAFLRSFRT